MRRKAAFPIGFLFVVATAVACSPPPPAEPAALTAADAAAMDSLFASSAETFKAKDYEGFLANFEDNIIFMPPNGPRVGGKSQLREWITTGPAATPEFGFSNVQVFGRGDYAFATSDINMALEGLAPDQGKQLVVFHRGETGEWKIAAVSFNSNTPLPAP